MSVKLYVGNIPYDVSEHELQSSFAAYGKVLEVKIVIDKETQRPRGFAFVTMDTGSEEAAEALDQTDFGGRKMVVNVAREKGRSGGSNGQKRERSGRQDPNDRHGW